MAKKKTGLQVTTGIALALTLFALFNLGVHTFYPSPEYNDYCSYDVYRPGEENNKTAQDYQACDNAYDIDKEAYNNRIFYVFVIAGLLFAITGLFITYLPFQIVGIGAGSALIIEGIIRNLENKIPAFIAGVLVFLILSYFVWKKARD
jgi:hypothetical protein